MTPQPIATAPRDGTVILTNCGLAYFDKHGFWDIPAWYACKPNGSSLNCVVVEPTLWVPKPDWIQ